MSIKDQIRAEIERRMETYNRSIDKYFGKKKSVQAERDSWKWAECKSILSFLDSLPEQPVEEIPRPIPRCGIGRHFFMPEKTNKEQPVSKELEEAAEEYEVNHRFVKNGFIGGAEWQKERMMKRAVKWLKEMGANNLYISMFQRDMEDEK